MNTIGYDLARHGFFVFAFDYGGHGESEDHPQSEEANVADVVCAIEKVRSYPQVDPARVVLVART